jgi:hypothetical protein
MRTSIVRINKRQPIRTLLRSYGIGGAENYEWEQINGVLRGIALILENTGLIELEQVGKFLLRLSDYPEAVDRALEELEDMGLFER